MSGDLRALLAVGTRVACDGRWWQVSELDGPHVLLASPAGVRRVSAGHLLADPSTRLQEAPGAPVEGAGAELAGLGEAELAELRARVAHVQEVRTGFRRGCVELAAAGEPRPKYAPGVPLLARYAAKAAEIGVGVSTLRRWVKDFGEQGPAGLADDRWRRRQLPLAGADPRWLEMARRVLAEHTEASKPTQDLVLAEVAARVGAEHGDGAVPVPKPTRARILLREISKGTSAFGGTKAKREIAGRPATPYGRLQAMRPGEYLLLDTTRLDVFAMDPVTLHWVQAELTAVMDLYDRPGYKGPDVYWRGKNPEQQAFYFLDELEQIIRRWTRDCYHRQPHAGLCVPEVPGLEVSPLEMFAHGIARAGYLQVPARADLAFDFLKVEWRTIQHYGVEIGGLRYDGPALNPYRNRTSPYAGKYAGRWPLRVDPGDVSRVWFQDPADNTWHMLRWEHADAAGGQFSGEALAYARQLATAAHRFPDTRRALAELLEQWGAGLAGNRAERRMALRISEQRLRLVPDPPVTGHAPEPAVISGEGGDDDSDGELDAPFPGEEPGGGPGDFYADAMETV